MTHVVGAKGQVVIPKDIRERIGIKPGDQVIFELDGWDVKVRRVADEPDARAMEIKSLRGIWADLSDVGTAALEEERRREQEREERKVERWGIDRP